ncbi:unnamed protein product, partial [marine sediment metagenome]
MSADPAVVSAPLPASGWREFFAKEDWWAIWIGLALVIAAVVAFALGGSIKWIAVTPQKWSSVGQALAQFGGDLPRYLALFVLWLVLFGTVARALGLRLAQFLPGFAVLFVVATLIYFVGLWERAAYYSLEPPLVALVVGLIVSNLFELPDWFKSALRVEFYIKTGIVLLGAGVPLALIVWAGPVAIVQAA